MKIFSIVSLISLLFCCGPKASHTNAHNAGVNFVRNECDNQVNFGDVPICLVEIDGMKECYSNPLVKVYMDQFRFENNEILGMYLNNDVHSKIDKLGEFLFDDYFKVYSMSSIKNMSLGHDELELIASETEKVFDRKNWADLESRLENRIDNVSFDRPIILDSHWPNKNIKTYVCLMKIESNGISNILVMNMNLALIKNTIICYAYYKRYAGEESINQAKAKSDYFGLKLYEANS